MLKHVISAFIATGLLLAASATQAAFVYDVNFDIAGSNFTGTITTDETTGVLSDGNLLDYTIFSPSFQSTTFTLAFARSAGGGSSLFGSVVSATTQTLQFDSTKPGHLFGSNSDLSTLFDICGNSRGFFCSAGKGTTRDNSIGVTADSTPDQNPITIARRSLSPIPLPAALPLFLGALAGLGGLGFMKRRKKDHS